MSVSDPLLKTLKLQILELHHSLQFLSATNGNESVEGCSSSSRISNNGSGGGGGGEGVRTSVSPDSSANNYEEPITDSNFFLIPLCRTLEEIFRKGVSHSTGSLLSLSIKKDDYWRWIEALASSDFRMPPPLRAAIEAVKNDERVLTYVGKGTS